MQIPRAANTQDLATALQCDPEELLQLGNFVQGQRTKHMAYCCNQGAAAARGNQVNAGAITMLGVHVLGAVVIMSE